MADDKKLSYESDFTLLFKSEGKEAILKELEAMEKEAQSVQNTVDNIGKKLSKAKTVKVDTSEAMRNLKKLQSFMERIQNSSKNTVKNNQVFDIAKQIKDMGGYNDELNSMFKNMSLKIDGVVHKGLDDMLAAYAKGGKSIGKIKFNPPDVEHSAKEIESATKKYGNCITKLVKYNRDLQKAMETNADPISISDIKVKADAAKKSMQELAKIIKDNNSLIDNGKKAINTYNGITRQLKVAKVGREVTSTLKTEDQPAVTPVSQPTITKDQVKTWKELETAANEASKAFEKAHNKLAQSLGEYDKFMKENSDVIDYMEKIQDLSKSVNNIGVNFDGFSAAQKKSQHKDYVESTREIIQKLIDVGAFETNAVTKPRDIASYRKYEESVLANYNKTTNDTMNTLMQKVFKEIGALYSKTITDYSSFDQHMSSDQKAKVIRKRELEQQIHFENMEYNTTGDKQTLAYQALHAFERKFEEIGINIEEYVKSLESSGDKKTETAKVIEGKTETESRAAVTEATKKEIEAKEKAAKVTESITEENKDNKKYGKYSEEAIINRFNKLMNTIGSEGSIIDKKNDRNSNWNIRDMVAEVAHWYEHRYSESPLEYGGFEDEDERKVWHSEKAKLKRFVNTFGPLSDGVIATESHTSSYDNYVHPTKNIPEIAQSTEAEITARKENVDAIEQETLAHKENKMNLEDKIERLEDIANQYGTKISQSDRNRYEQLNFLDSNRNDGLTDKEYDRYSELQDTITQADSALKTLEEDYDRIVLKLEGGTKVEITIDDSGLNKLEKIANEYFSGEYNGKQIKDINFVNSAVKSHMSRLAPEYKLNENDKAVVANESVTVEIVVSQDDSNKDKLREREEPVERILSAWSKKTGKSFDSFGTPDETSWLLSFDNEKEYKEFAKFWDSSKKELSTVGQLSSAIEDNTKKLNENAEAAKKDAEAQKELEQTETTSNKRELPQYKIGLDERNKQMATSSSFVFMDDKGQYLENEAQRVLDGFVKQLTSVYDIQKITDEQFELMKERIAGYASLITSKYNDRAYREGSNPSWAVTGPAGFNQKKFDKAMEAEMNSMKKFEDKQEKFIENTFKMINKLTPAEEQIRKWREGKFEYGEHISDSDPLALDKYKAKLEYLKEQQKLMKDANAYYKKNKTMLGFEGLSEDSNKSLDEALNSDNWFGKKQPFQPFKLTNNNSMIKATQAMVDKLEKMAVDAVENEIRNFDGGQLIKNKSINRLQLKFDEIPDAEMRNQLKSSGWHWSKKEMAWQRQLTENAERSAEKILAGLNLTEKNIKDVNANISKQVQTSQQISESERQILSAEKEKQQQIYETSNGQLAFFGGIEDSKSKNRFSKLKKVKSGTKVKRFNTIDGQMSLGDIRYESDSLQREIAIAEREDAKQAAQIQAAEQNLFGSIETSKKEDAARSLIKKLGLKTQGVVKPLRELLDKIAEKFQTDGVLSNDDELLNQIVELIAANQIQQPVLTGKSQLENILGNPHDTTDNGTRRSVYIDKGTNKELRTLKGKEGAKQLLDTLFGVGGWITNKNKKHSTTVDEVAHQFYEAGFNVRKESDGREDTSIVGALDQMYDMLQAEQNERELSQNELKSEIQSNLENLLGVSFKGQSDIAKKKFKLSNSKKYKSKSTKTSSPNNNLIDLIGSPDEWEEIVGFEENTTAEVSNQNKVLTQTQKSESELLNIAEQRAQAEAKTFESMNNQAAVSHGIADISEDPTKTRMDDIMLSALRNAKNNKTSAIDLSKVEDNVDLTDVVTKFINDAIKGSDFRLSKVSAARDANDNRGFSAVLVDEKTQRTYRQKYFYKPDPTIPPDEFGNPTNTLQYSSDFLSQDLDKLRKMEEEASKKLADINRKKNELKSELDALIVKAQAASVPYADVDTAVENIKDDQSLKDAQSKIKILKNDIKTAYDKAKSDKTMDKSARVEKDLTTLDDDISRLRSIVDRRITDAAGKERLNTIISEMESAGKKAKGEIKQDNGKLYDKMDQYAIYGDKKITFAHAFDSVIESQRLNDQQAKAQSQNIKKTYNELLSTVQKINNIDSEVAKYKGKDDGTGVFDAYIEKLRHNKQELLSEFNEISNDLSKMYDGKIFERKDIAMPLADGQFEGVKSFFADTGVQAELSAQQIQKFVDALTKVSATEQNVQGRFKELSLDFDAVQKRLSEINGLDLSKMFESKQGLNGMSLNDIKGEIQGIINAVQSGERTIAPDSAEADYLEKLIGLYVKYGNQLADIAEIQSRYFAGKSTNHINQSGNAAFEVQALEQEIALEQKLINEAKKLAKEKYNADNIYTQGFKTDAKTGISTLDFSVYDKQSQTMKKLQAESGDAVQGIYITESAVNKLTNSVVKAQQQITSMNNLVAQLGDKGFAVDGENVAEPIKKVVDVTKQLEAEVSKGNGASPTIITQLISDAKQATGELTKLYSQTEKMNSILSDQTKRGNGNLTVDTFKEAAKQDESKYEQIIQKMQSEINRFANNKNTYITGRNIQPDGISTVDFSVYDKAKNSIESFRVSLGGLNDDFNYTSLNSEKAMSKTDAAVKQLSKTMQTLKTLNEQGIPMNAEDKQTSQAVQKMHEAMQKLNDETKREGGGDSDLIAIYTKELSQATTNVDKLLQKSIKLKSAIESGDVKKLSAMSNTGGKSPAEQLKSAISDDVSQNYKNATVTFGKFNEAAGKIPVTIRTASGEIRKCEGYIDSLTGAMGIQETAVNKVTQSVSKSLNVYDKFKASLSSMKSQMMTAMIGYNVFYKAIDAIKTGIGYVKEIDLAMTELKKVTDNTADAYDKFINNAYGAAGKVGATVSEFTVATSNFARLGYDINQSADMAQTAVVYKNVAD